MSAKIEKSKEDKIIAELTAKNLKKNRGELYHVRQMDVPKLVNKYLSLGTVTYTQRINAYDALESLGYKIPKYDGQAIVEFKGKGVVFAKALQSVLIELGFKADRSFRNQGVKNTETEHTPRATVYTNIPPTVYFKAAKALMHAKKALNSDHSASIEMDVFEKKFSTHYRNGEIVLADTHNTGKKLNKISNAPEESFSTFLKEYEVDEEEVFRYFKDRTTDKYRIFLGEEE